MSVSEKYTIKKYFPLLEAANHIFGRLIHKKFTALETGNKQAAPVGGIPNPLPTYQENLQNSRENKWKDLRNHERLSTLET